MTEVYTKPAPDSHNHLKLGGGDHDNYKKKEEKDTRLCAPAPPPSHQLYLPFVPTYSPPPPPPPSPPGPFCSQCIAPPSPLALFSAYFDACRSQSHHSKKKAEKMGKHAKDLETKKAGSSHRVGA